MKVSNLLLVLFFIALPFAYALYLFPTLPATIPTHFNASGEADAWGDKSSIFLLPVIMGVVSLFVYFVLSNAKKLDPKRYADNDDSVMKNFGFYTVLFLAVLSLVIMYATSHPGVPIEKLIFSFLGLAFGVLGLFMPRLKQNYFAGIRLPWTLDSQANWIATHQVAGKIWAIGGGLQFLLGLIIQGEWMVYAFMSIVILMVLIPTVYSYLFFRKEKSSK